MNIHKQLFHHNIVQFQGHFEDQSDIYIIMDLCKNQTLKELI